MVGAVVPALMCMVAVCLLGAGVFKARVDDLRQWLLGRPERIIGIVAHWCVPLVCVMIARECVAVFLPHP